MERGEVLTEPDAESGVEEGVEWPVSEAEAEVVECTEHPGGQAVTNAGNGGLSVETELEAELEAERALRRRQVTADIVFSISLGKGGTTKP
jgi:hypothetical protein